MYCKWLIIVFEVRRGFKDNFNFKILDLLLYMNKGIEKYSTAVMSDIESQKDWENISKHSKESLNMIMLMVTLVAG